MPPAILGLESVSHFDGSHAGHPADGGVEIAGDFDGEGFVRLVGKDGGVPRIGGLGQGGDDGGAEEGGDAVAVQDDAANLVAGGEGIGGAGGDEDVEGPGGVVGQFDAAVRAIEEDLGLGVVGGGGAADVGGGLGVTVGGEASARVGDLCVEAGTGIDSAGDGGEGSVRFVVPAAGDGGVFVANGVEGSAADGACLAAGHDGVAETTARGVDPCVSDATAGTRNTTAFERWYGEVSVSSR